MKISKETFQKTSSWIKRNARPLETARWEYVFENGSKDRVLHILSAFQNEDGGFGHGIEPDFWLPHSSPMATWAAGEILMEIDVDPNEKIVKSMVSYLTNTPQIDTGIWSSVLPENNQHPHAPWWHWQQGVQRNWMFNPSVQLSAFLVAWSPSQSTASQIGWISLKKAVNHLMENTEMDRHEINNYQQLIKLMEPYEATFYSKIHYSLNDISEKILKLVEGCVDKDVSNWSTGYKALPLDFIDSPDDPLCERIGALVEQNLKFYLEQMSDEGIWDISWSWGNYPEEFAVAKRYWKGILAVKRYSILKAFGWIE